MIFQQHELPDAEAGDSVMPESRIRELVRKPGRILRRVRDLRGEALDTTAYRCGISLERLARLESDLDLPTREEVLRLSEHFRGDPRVLLNAFGFAA